MDARTATRYRRRLLDELGQRGHLLGQLKRSVAEQGQQYIENGGAFANHMADCATEEADRESAYLLADVQGRTIHEIEEAIRRIDDGVYGTCEFCGLQIDRRRLDVLPQARFCLKCQEKQERLRRN